MLIVGSVITGWASDHLIINGKKARSGRWLPEDRLKAAWPGTLLLAPLSVIGYGLTTVYVEGPKGVVFNMFWIFINGLAVTNVMNPCNVYGVDIFYTRSAEVVAAFRCVLRMSSKAHGSTGLDSTFRHSIVSLTAAVVLPIIETIGVAYAGALFAFISWLTCL
jgi:hypothetical protein